MAHELAETSPRTGTITLRPAAPADRDLLLELYRSTRADELAVVDWTPAEKDAFVEGQFGAQDAWYRQIYPQGEFSVVHRDGVAIGRLYLAVLADEIRLIDITLLPAQRGCGVGSQLIDDVLARADESGLAVRLHVEPWNPARRLYERRGFRVLEQRGIYLFMERSRPGVS